LRLYNTAIQADIVFPILVQLLLQFLMTGKVSTGRLNVFSFITGGNFVMAEAKGRGRGFASMSPEKQRQIASKGGRAAHAMGTAHEWNSNEARAAGRKGGSASRRRIVAN
jgi:uncharacterized protein